VGEVAGNRIRPISVPTLPKIVIATVGHVFDSFALRQRLHRLEGYTNNHHSLLRILVKRMSDLYNTLHNREDLVRYLQRGVSGKLHLKGIGRQ
jgi:hypothetical protein